MQIDKSRSTVKCHRNLFKVSHSAPTTCSCSMELHIYRQGTSDRLVKDGSKESVLYFIESPYKWTYFPPKTVYRGESAKAPAIATINRDGYFRPTYTVKFPGLADVVVGPPSTFGGKSKFTWRGKEFAWECDTELVEVSSGKVLARFDRKVFSMKKKGVISIFGVGIEMVDVIALTGISMQYHWEEKRLNRARGKIGP